MGATLEAGVVRLAFAADGPGQPTRLTERYACHPLAVQRATYADPALPGQAQVHLLCAGAGILAADDLRLEVDVGPHAAVLLRDVGATRIHPCAAAEGGAALHVALRLGAAASLEWLPDPLIPFTKARFRQTIEVELDPGACWIGSELVVAGRCARGERLAFTALDQSLVVRAGRGGPALLAEAVRLRPEARRLDGPATLGDHTVWGTLRVVAPGRPAAALVQALRDALGSCADVCGGVSALAGEAGAVARVLGPTPQAASQALRRAWDAARRQCLGAPAPPPRRY